MGSDYPAKAMKTEERGAEQQRWSFLCLPMTKVAPDMRMGSAMREAQIALFDLPRHYMALKCMMERANKV